MLHVLLMSYCPCYELYATSVRDPNSATDRCKTVSPVDFVSCLCV